MINYNKAHWDLGVEIQQNTDIGIRLSQLSQEMTGYWKVLRRNSSGRGTLTAAAPKTMLGLGTEEQREALLSLSLLVAKQVTSLFPKERLVRHSFENCHLTNV